jgi:hypothetical protein
MWRWRRVRAPLAAAALALATGACGDNGPGRCPEGQTGTPPNCTPIIVEQPCTQTNVLQDGTAVESGWLIYDEFSVPDTGRLDTTVDWTFASSEIGFYVVPAGTCNSIEEFNARSCNFVVRSEASTTKPRKISTPNFAAGNYRWMIGNFGDQDESASFQMVLSKGTGCGPMAGGAPSASGAGTDGVSVERMRHR